jgi:hypothetical protein
VGAGGLWGGFGLLKTERETFSMWISRTDRFVIVRLRNARPLLVTPDDPDRFVEDVKARGPRVVSLPSFGDPFEDHEARHARVRHELRRSHPTQTWCPMVGQ